MDKGRPNLPEFMTQTDLCPDIDWEFVDKPTSETVNMVPRGPGSKAECVEMTLNEDYNYIDPRTEKLKRLRGVIAEREASGKDVYEHYIVVRKLCDAIELTPAENDLIPELEDPVIARARLEGRVEGSLLGIRLKVDSVEGLGERIDGFQGLIKDGDLNKDVCDLLNIKIKEPETEEGLVIVEQVEQCNSLAG